MCVCVWAAKYAVNAKGTNLCATGYSRISDEPTCQAAALSLGGYNYRGSVPRPAWTAGCLLDAPNGDVWLNEDPTGAGNANFQPLCLLTGTSWGVLTVGTPRRI